MNKTKKTSLLITLLTSTLIISGCQDLSISTPNSDNSSVSSINNNSEAYYHEPVNGVTVIRQVYETVNQDGLTFKIDELKKEFLLNRDALYEKDSNKKIISYPYGLFMIDANNDGYRDFVFFTNSDRSRRQSGTWVGIYDYYNNKELYRLDDAGEFDYLLKFNNDQLFIEQYITDEYDTDNVIELNRLVGKGTFNCSSNNIDVDWLNYLKVDSFNFAVTLADESRAKINLKQGEDKDTYIVENASVDVAYCITTNIVRDNNNFDDLTDNLPVGYRLNEECRYIQARANNTQDNVIVTLNGDKLKYLDKKSAFVEAFVSGYKYRIIFEYNSLDYNPNDKKLIDVLGWNFTKDDLVGFSREFIPDSLNEPVDGLIFPFVNIGVARDEETAKESYKMLDGLVVDIDPSLVIGLDNPSYYHFQTNEKTYSFVSSATFIRPTVNTNGDIYYLIIYSLSYSYAISNSYYNLRFRDEYNTVLAQPNIPGVEAKNIESLNKIVFDRGEIRSSEKDTYYKGIAEYFIVIEGKKYYIKDKKTMFDEDDKYIVVSENDFSFLFQ